MYIDSLSSFNQLKKMKNKRCQSWIFSEKSSGSAQVAQPSNGKTVCEDGKIVYLSPKSGCMNSFNKMKMINIMGRPVR